MFRLPVARTHTRVYFLKYPLSSLHPALFDLIITMRVRLACEPWGGVVMAVITNSGTYSPVSVSVRGTAVASKKLDSSRTALTEASGSQDRAEISKEAAQLQLQNAKKPLDIVQVLASSTGRTQAKITTMRDLAPPVEQTVGFSEFKGTKALVDSRAAAAARMRSIDLTVGGPNATQALKDSPIFKAPEKAPQDDLVEQQKKAAEEEKAKSDAIEEAKAAAKRAADRLMVSQGVKEPQEFGQAQKPEVAVARAPQRAFGQGEPQAVNAAGRAEGTGRTAPAERQSAAERPAQRPQPQQPAMGTRGPVDQAAAGKTLNFLA